MTKYPIKCIVCGSKIADMTPEQMLALPESGTPFRGRVRKCKKTCTPLDDWRFDVETIGATP